MRELDASARLMILTVTLGHDDIREGHAALVKAFEGVQKMRAWKDNVLRGHGQVEILRAQGGMRRWNVHAHLLVEVTPKLTSASVNRLWRKQVANAGLAGRAHVRAATRDFEPGKHGGDFNVAAYYVSKNFRREWFGMSSLDLAEVTLATRGLRLRKSFGDKLPTPAREAKRETVAGSAWRTELDEIFPRHLQR